MKKEIFLIIAVLVIFSAGLSLASFSYKGSSIEQNYSEGDIIKGTINISLSSEPADSVFESNFNGSIKLIDLLKANQLEEKTDYTCTYPGCFDNYKVLEAVSGAINLNPDSSPLIAGFKVVGESVEITSLKFSLASSAGPSCSRPLLIDVLDKNESFIQSVKSSGVICSEEYSGCFNSGAPTILADITTGAYCERVGLAPAPAYKIGAFVKKGTAFSSLRMNLNDVDWNLLGECELPVQTMEEEKIGCVINRSVTTNGEYFVCIRSVDFTDYKIRTEEVSPMCGTSTGSEPYNIDFDIFANAVQFAALGNISVNSSTFSELNSGEDLAAYADGYINEVYQRNCSSGCFVPFKISGAAQDLTFSNAELKYRKGGIAALFTENILYKLEKDESKITTPNPININLEMAGFTIPLGSQASKLYLYLNGEEILPDPIDIVILPSFEFDILPKNILFGNRVNFQAQTASKIVSSSWNFGDGTSKVSSGGSTAHRYTNYNQSGYKLEVELTRDDGRKARKSFDISVGSLEDSATNLTSEYELRIDSLSKQIDLFSPFAANRLKSILNLTKMRDSLGILKRTLVTLADDAGYLSYIDKVLAINPPASVRITEEGRNLPIESGLNNFDVAYIEQISETSLGTDDAREQLKKAIHNWAEKNYDAKVSYEMIAQEDDDGKESVLLTKFKVVLTKKQGADESAGESYLIINYPKESIVFAGNYSEKVVGSGTYVPVSDSATLEFLITTSVGISSLGMYLSPQIGRLEGFEDFEVVKKEGFKWGRFFFLTILLLVIALAIYIALQEWYKKKYETYLFKNSADLYNVINFIYNSRTKKLSDEEIAKKLKDVGWKGEQITYAFKKLDGKRTGMYEIHILRFWEQMKIRKEIEKRRMPQTVQTITTITQKKI